MENDNKHRLISVALNPGNLCSILRGEVVFTEKIPQDAKVIRWYIDDQRPESFLMIILQSEKFDSVPEDGLVPVRDLTYFKRGNLK